MASDAAKARTLDAHEFFLTTQNGLRFAVEVIEYVRSYGRDRARIRPLNGDGETVVNVERLETH